MPKSIRDIWKKKKFACIRCIMSYHLYYSELSIKGASGKPLLQTGIQKMHHFGGVTSWISMKRLLKFKIRLSEFPYPLSRSISCFAVILSKQHQCQGRQDLTEFYPILYDFDISEGSALKVLTWSIFWPIPYTFFIKIKT